MVGKKLLATIAISFFALSLAQADEAKEKSDEMRTQTEHAADEQRIRRERMSVEDRAEIIGDAHSKADAAENNGNEAAQKMRDRREQRKEIMDAEKSADKLGHHDDEGESEVKAKEKKPWWKFWGD